MAWILSNWSIVATALWGVCEVLALIPGVKSNSVFQLLFNMVQDAMNKVNPPAQLPPSA